MPTAETTNHLSGLSTTEIAARRQQYGENVLTPPRRRSLWQLYVEKYQDPIVRILLVAAFLSLALAFVSGDFIETIGIILAIFFATTVGFYFERDAVRRFDVLTALGEEQPVKVRRDGHVSQIARREVVVGDIVLLETGDEVPADGRLLLSNSLQVDESSLTGEPVAEKNAQATAADGHAQAYPPNVVLRSSMVMSGTATCVVTAVGDVTEIGRVARQATELTGVKTPLNQQLDRLAQLISKVGSVLSFAAFFSFLIHDVLTSPLWHTDNYVGMLEVVLQYFMMAVTLIVMAVPEGLPMAVTLALALNMRRMLKSNILVRKLSATETMGAVSVICTDKTGTLTQNVMRVAHISTIHTPPSSLLLPPSSLLFHAIALNSTAELDGQQGVGNPTEVALLRYLQEQGVDYRQLRAEAAITDQVPFSTERKYMQTTATLADGSSHTFVKGAPEIVLAQCHWTDDAEQKAVSDLLLQWQRQAMRTLALTCDQHFLAVVAISDPVRPDVPQAVSDCRQAGIEVKIVTGDTQATAMEIGRQIGIVDADAAQQDPDAHITGTDFSRLTDEEALASVDRLKVMSRARPTDKQRLVQLLQQRGNVVAVTGDGTNDAPALNHAHIGLSLGSGTSVAKHASDITIIDDSFRSVVKAVEWGRSIYRNIQRFIFFQLVVNVTALLLVLCGSLIGTELPLTVTQILWINLIMDTFAAMALASLPPSHDVMRQQPRQPSDFIISRSVGRGILLTGLLFFAFTFVYLYWLENRAGGAGVDIYELTKFFTVFVMLQWWNLFNAKTLGSDESAFCNLRHSRGFLLVLVMILGGQWLIVELGGQMFRTVPLPLIDWLQIVGGTSVVLIAGELYRFFRRRH